MTSNPAALSRPGACGLRTVEFLMRDAEVPQNGSDGSRFQFMAAPVGDVVLRPFDDRIQISWSPRARLSRLHPSRRSLRVSSPYLKLQP